MDNSFFFFSFVSGKSGARGSIFSIMNMDAQDAQDEQDERFLHEKLAQPMTRCGLADAQDYKLAVSGKILCILCIHVNNPFKRYAGLQNAGLLKPNPVNPAHPC